MLKILVKKQLGDIFRSYTYDAKKNRARSKEATIGFTVLFVVLMVGVLGGLFTLLSLAMCESMAQVGMSWLYFTIMTLLAAFLGIFGSVFNTYSTLYMAKDNDLLLSLPIPVRTIMAARLVSVYLMGLMYSAVVLLPAIIVYWVVVGITVPVVVGCMIQLLLLSVFVLTLSCALGWVVAKISQKLKNKSFITVLVSLVFIGAYYFFYAKAQSLLTELLANAAYYGASIRTAAYPLYLVGRVAMGNGSAIAIVSAAVLGLFTLVWYLIARSFLKLATSTGAVAKVEYREKGRSPAKHRPGPAGPGAEPVHRQRQLYAQLRHGHPGPGHWRGGAGVEGRQPPSDAGARVCRQTRSPVGAAVCGIVYSGGHE